MNARQAHWVIRRWVASDLIGGGWMTDSLSAADEGRLESAAFAVADQMLRGAGRDARTRGTLEEIIRDVLSEDQ